MNREERKKYLQSQLKAIATEELADMVKENLPQYKKLEGKCFKRRNSYGGNNKDWWMYTKVIAINAKDLYASGENCLCKYHGISFEVRPDGIISIESKEEGYVHCLGNEISEQDYNVAYNKMIEKINSL